MSQTQICTTCHTEKPVEQYSFRDKKKGRRHRRCKACHAAYRRQHYQENRKKYIGMARDWDADNHQRLVDRARRYVFNYLCQNPCVDCGETNVLVLEFDHIYGKTTNISQMIHDNPSMENLKKEVAKCAVRCACCHRIRTALQQNWSILSVLRECGVNYLQKKSPKETKHG
jgi:excinuclease UvrABC ATPase subunit